VTEDALRSSATPEADQGEIVLRHYAQRWTARLGKFAVPLRFILLVGVSLAVVGLVARVTTLPMLTATLGPTAYVFAAYPTANQHDCDVQLSATQWGWAWA